VGRERPHSQLLRQRQRLAVVALGVLDVRRLAARRDLAQEAERVCLGALFLAFARVRESPRGYPCRIVRAAGQQVGLSQPQLSDGSSGQTETEPASSLLH